MSFNIVMRTCPLDTLQRIALKFDKEESTGKRPDLGVFDKLEFLTVFIYQLLGVEPVVNETEKRRIYIFEDHRLSLAPDHCTAESSAKEVGRIKVGDNLVDSELLLGGSFADNDGNEALGFRRAMICQKKKFESRVDYGRRGFKSALIEKKKKKKKNPHEK
jgi:hypothetical protein